MKVYTTDRSTDRSRSERVKVGVADYAVAETGSELVTSGLGSCVGIALVDPEAGVAGLAHAMLPKASDGRHETDGGNRASSDGPTPPSETPNEAKYVDTAVRGLLRSMVDAGADRSRVEARVAGGSAMFDFDSGDGGIGERNVAAVEEVLADHDIPIVATDVGGDHGRSLSLDAATGALSVRRAHDDTRVL
ncbi:chemotaxis protein CheD [Halobellus rubicundus]|uniref:Probable chemoreceptor glutamine deamidase CheD n=1 Tax=Halobellus rubicundus TaxID=2996466 RepID=A0ABD5MGY7_9EURY